MSQSLFTTAAAAVLALFVSSCDTYDPNNPNDPFNQQLDATYGAPGGAAQPGGTAPGRSSQLPTQPKPKPTVTAAPGRGDIGRLLQLTNLERSRNGVGSVRPDARLTRAAQNHSQYLAATGVLNHTGPNGENAGGRMLDQRYTWRAYAENLANADTAEKAITQWMNSPPHRANLLNPIYADVGIGYVNGYWTIVFGRHR
ncbi:MAG: CAP domain-containing protein [Verrucomicrobiales bacterium]|nr:CAP domain-containing protein [Verrucomicrobiales bacterium]